MTNFINLSCEWWSAHYFILLLEFMYKLQFVQTISTFSKSQKSQVSFALCCNLQISWSKTAGIPILSRTLPTPLQLVASSLPTHSSHSCLRHNQCSIWSFSSWGRHLLIISLLNKSSALATNFNHWDAANSSLKHQLLFTVN